MAKTATKTKYAPLGKALERLGDTVQKKAESKAALPVQLPIWDDDLRAIARGALFTAAKADSKTKRDVYRGKRVATLSGIEIVYQGEELRQDDYSVLLQILHFGRRYELGKPIPFTAYQMLKELGWSINSAEYKHLRECCERLSANSVSVSTDGGATGNSGSLLRGFSWRDEAGEQLSQWQVLLEPSIAGLFSDPSFSLMDPAERKAIGGRSPLALWLHSFLSTHREPFPYSVTKYQELSASKDVNLNDFRRRLKIALQRLVETGFLKAWKIVNDVVHVKRVAKNFRGPALPAQAALA